MTSESAPASLNQTIHSPAFHRVLQWGLVGAIFAAGLAARLFDLTDLPLDFHPTRQLHSALIARGMYYQNLETAPQWQRDMAVLQWKREGIIEPPFMEWLAAESYRITGAELLWIPRLYSILFWTAGGIGLFLLSRRISSMPGAIAALAFYMILPYGVIASRAFQPDPLMTALIVWAWWAVQRWSEKPGYGWAAAAGLLGGAAILVKSVAVFFIAPAFAATTVQTLGFKKAVHSGKIWIMAALAILPYGAYLVYGVWGAGFLASQFSQRFFPELWVNPGFYLQWSRKIDLVTGLPWFLLAIAGSFLYSNRKTRVGLSSLWAGYFVYGLALSHHIGTHDYYSLPLIPLAALGLAGSARVIFDNFTGKTWWRGALAASLLIFGAGYDAWEARTTLDRVDYRPEEKFWRQVGEFLGHDSNVIALTQDYGARLEYWGWVNAITWPWLDDMAFQGLGASDGDIRARFEQDAAGRDYFLVTVPEELSRQPALREILSSYAVVFKEGNSVIYDLQKPAK